MSAPIDAPVRQRALGVMESFIVQAPAGSGKTELLTRRVLTLLAAVDEPEQILAITFTKKAASEMRQRVMETLEKAAAGVKPANEHEAEGLVLAELALHQDKVRGWQLLRNPQRLNLRTIDSLATRLAHRLPVTSSLGAPIGMVENADRLYREAAGRFIDNNIEALDLILLQLGNKLEKAQTLLANLLANRDQWKRHVYAAGNDHEHLRQMLEGMLSELVESRLENLQALVPDGLESALVPRLKIAFEFCLQDVDGDIDELDWEIQTWFDIHQLPGSQLSDMNVWASIAHALLTGRGKGDVRKAVTKTIGFPAKGDAKKREVEPAILVEHKQLMLDLLAKIENEPAFIEALKEVCRLPYPRYQDEQWALLSQLLKVLPDLLVELQLVFAEHAVVDFSEISERAQRALGPPDEPTDLALSMDLQIRHMLVDEFQDTSQTQFRLFTQLVSGWEAGDGRTFFAVGDPMQSIYRFREGDVALFTQAQQHGIGPVHLEPLTLSVNFRTTPEISRWVNDTFSSIFPDIADTNTGAVPYSPSDAFLKSQGAVSVHPLIDAGKSDEASLVVDLCQQAVALSDAHQVAILVRSRSQATEIFHALRERQLPYQSIDMDLVGERGVVLDLIALCLALRYPHDRLHWLSILRAPFVGLTLHDLHTLMHDASSSATVFSLLMDEQRLRKMTDDGTQRVERFLSIMTPAVNRSQRSRLMPWVESVWLQLGGPVTCIDTVTLDAAERAIDAMVALEGAGMLRQRSHIEEAMSKLFVEGGQPENCQIQIMTLHKAKGLEFDTVIVPALNRQARADSTQLLNWYEGNLDGKPQLLLAPFEQSGLHPNQRDPLNKMVRRARERCDEQEKIRLLYVACTRAKQHLHLVGIANLNTADQLKSPVGGSLLHPLWPLLEADFEAAARTVQKSKLPNDAAQLQDLTQTDLFESADQNESAGNFRRVSMDSDFPRFSHYQMARQEDALEETSDAPAELQFSWAGREARDIGTTIHHQLQILASADTLPTPASIDTLQTIVQRQLRNLGIRSDSLGDAAVTVMQALKNTLSDERGCWILAAHEEARTEWALTATGSAGDQSVRAIIIDRTFVDSDGVRWIVDYKTGSHQGSNVEAFMDSEQERYADQLQRYADIIGRLDHRPIRVGLYFPLLKGWREWAPEKVSQEALS